jgi:hypothetical protein
MSVCIKPPYVYYVRTGKFIVGYPADVFVPCKVF